MDNSMAETTHTAEMEVEETTELPTGYEHIEKNIYLHRRRRKLEKHQVMICSCEVQQIGEEFTGCGEKCHNKVMCIECHSQFCPCGDYCTNQRISKLQYPKLAVVNTSDKGRGLVVMQDLSPGDFVIEYVGEVFDYRIFRERAVEYARLGEAHFFIMALGEDEFIDATRKANLSRFMNHSCNPNCETQKWTVSGEIRIGIFAKQFIPAGTELTFDYQFERYGSERQQCMCGEPQCRGWLGGEKEVSLKQIVYDDEVEVEDEERIQLNLATLIEEIKPMLDKNGDLLAANVKYFAKKMYQTHTERGRSLMVQYLKNTTMPCKQGLVMYNIGELLQIWMQDSIYELEVQQAREEEEKKFQVTRPSEDDSLNVLDASQGKDEMDLESDVSSNLSMDSDFDEEEEVVKEEEEEVVKEEKKEEKKEEEEVKEEKKEEEEEKKEEKKEEEKKEEEVKEEKKEEEEKKEKKEEEEVKEEKKEEEVKEEKKEEEVKEEEEEENPEKALITAPFSAIKQIGDIIEILVEWPFSFGALTRAKLLPIISSICDSQELPSELVASGKKLMDVWKNIAELKNYKIPKRSEESKEKDMEELQKRVEERKKEDAEMLQRQQWYRKRMHERAQNRPVYQQNIKSDQTAERIRNLLASSTSFQSQFNAITALNRNINKSAPPPIRDPSEGILMKKQVISAEEAASLRASVAERLGSSATGKEQDTPTTETAAAKLKEVQLRKKKELEESKMRETSMIDARGLRDWTGKTVVSRLKHYFSESGKLQIFKREDFKFLAREFTHYFLDRERPQADGRYLWTDDLRRKMHKEIVVYFKLALNSRKYNRDNHRKSFKDLQRVLKERKKKASERRKRRRSRIAEKESKRRKMEKRRKKMRLEEGEKEEEGEKLVVPPALPLQPPVEEKKEMLVEERKEEVHVPVVHVPIEVKPIVSESEKRAQNLRSLYGQ